MSSRQVAKQVPSRNQKLKRKGTSKMLERAKLNDEQQQQRLKTTSSQKNGVNVVLDDADTDDENASGRLFPRTRDLYKNWLVAGGFIDPLSRARYRWDAFIAVLVVYTALMEPLRIGFRSHIEGKPGFEAIDVLMDTAFCLHIVFNFRTGVFEKYSLEPVYNQRSIARNYARVWFWIDAVSLPWSRLAGGAGGMKLLRMLRLLRVANFLKIRTANQGVRLVKIFFYLCVCGHWSGCLWFAVCDWLSFPDDGFCPSEAVKEGAMAQQYLQAVFWGMVSTVGMAQNLDPVTESQIVLSLVVCFTGVFVVGWVIGSIFEIVQAINAASVRYRQKTSDMAEWMQFRHFSGELQAKMKGYVRQQWTLTKGLDERAMLESLPHGLQAEICLEQYGKFIKEVPFFSDCTPGFITSIAMLLRQQVVLKGDYVFKEGEIASEMFFIARGTVTAFTRTTARRLGGSGVDDRVDVVRVFRTMHVGSFFGEIALLEDCARTASVMTDELCHLLSLSRSDFQRVLRLGPGLGGVPPTPSGGGSRNRVVSDDERNMSMRSTTSVDTSFFGGGGGGGEAGRTTSFFDVVMASYTRAGIGSSNGMEGEEEEEEGGVRCGR